ncbi:riboflavin transporter 2-like [Ptychodera flava]|uniref:riboflavin transporter 2-like n=1 Tax=Ptychodera flava TaxID=63121 RepID=UPI00396A8AC1
MEVRESTAFLNGVHTLVCLFGMASWLDINGVWVQLPIIVNYLPEGWALASYLVLVIQIANIGPIVFSIVNRFTSKRIEIPTNYSIIGIGMISCLLLIPFWDTTSYVNGEERSTAFLTLCAFLALVDCTSSVSFLAFMSLFEKPFMSSYFVGEGFSAFVPSVLGLLQGVGGNPECLNHTYVNSTLIGNTTINTTYYETEYYYPPPRYSVEVFFFLLALLLLTSLVSFALLVHLPRIKRIHVDEKVAEVDAGDTGTFVSKECDVILDVIVYSNSIADSVANDDATTTNNKLHKDKDDDMREKQKDGDETDTKDVTPTPLSTADRVYLLSLQGWACCLTNGIMPSIQSYSTLPYGNYTYHLAVTLGLMMIPTASLCVHWLPAKSNLSVGILSIVATLVSAYIFYLSLMSPYPPLCGSDWGPILSVTSWLIFYFVFTYVKVSIGGRFRIEGRTALIWYGGVTQIGSFVGAIVIFPLVNVLYIFKPNDPCEFTCY